MRRIKFLFEHFQPSNHYNVLILINYIMYNWFIQYDDLCNKFRVKKKKKKKYANAKSEWPLRCYLFGFASLSSCARALAIFTAGRERRISVAIPPCARWAALYGKVQSTSARSILGLFWTLPFYETFYFSLALMWNIGAMRDKDNLWLFLDSFAHYTRRLSSLLVCVGRRRWVYTCRRCSRSYRVCQEGGCERRVSEKLSTSGSTRARDFSTSVFCV